eukprot:359928-Chlamydomonas_euryale.AAC.3
MVINAPELAGDMFSFWNVHVSNNTSVLGVPRNCFGGHQLLLQKMTERTSTVSKHAFAGFCMTLPDSAQRPDGIIPNAWRQSSAGASFSLPKFKSAIQHSGFKGFDASSGQPMISLMQSAFVHQRIEKRMTDPAAAKGKDCFGDPKRLFAVERAKVQSLLEASEWSTVGFVVAKL